MPQRHCCVLIDEPVLCTAVSMAVLARMVVWLVRLWCLSLLFRCEGVGGECAYQLVFVVWHGV